LKDRILFLFRKITDGQFLKFILTGALNTAFGYCMFSLFVFLTKSPSYSVILANIVGVLFNFKTYGKLVFNSKDNSKLFRFCGVYVLITLLQISLIKVLKNVGLSDPYLAGAILLLPIAFLSYVLMKKFVFYDRKQITE